jgi:hypothetical protein
MISGRLSQFVRNFGTSAIRRSGGHDHGGIPGGVRIILIRICSDYKSLTPSWETMHFLNSCSLYDLRTNCKTSALSRLSDRLCCSLSNVRGTSV